MPQPYWSPAIKSRFSMTVMEESDSTVEDSQRNGPRVTGPEVRNGTILKIVVENFMCHDKLAMTFDSRINYFTGANGSGKSAMMTAIVLGLGGSSKHMDRGNSVLGLIKHGRNCALIHITLNNSVKTEAYNYPVYGPKIVVTRTLRHSGSSYKICNAKGATVSTRKEELDRIVDAFRISVSNPVCCMSQDMVKKFVRQSNPKSLYDKMAEGTGINYMKKMMEKNRMILIRNEAQIKGLDDVLRNLDKDIQANLKELHDLEKKLEAGTKIEKLELELAWVVVGEAETVLAAEQKKLDAVDPDGEGGSSQQILSDQLKEIAEAREQKKREIGEAKSAKADFEKQVVELRRKAAALRGEKSEKENAIANLRSKKIGLEQKCTALRQEFERSQSQQAANRLIEAKTKKSELEEHVPELEMSVSEKERELRELSLQVQSCETEMRAVTRKRHELELKQRDLNASKEHLRKDRSNVLAAYPRPFQVLAEAMKREQFDKRPIGPLGSCFRLKEKFAEWDKLVESILGLLMTTYICGSSDDARKLNALIKKTFTGQYFRSKPSVVSMTFGAEYKYMSDAVRTDQRGVCLLDALEFDSHLVKNALIDNRRAHQILLIKEDRVARAVMSRRDSVPRNCLKAYTSTNYEYHPAPQYRSYAFMTRDRANLLQVSGGDVLQRLEADLERLAAALDQVRRDENKIKENLQLAKNRRAHAEKELNRARVEFQDIQKRIRKLEHTIRIEESNVRQPTDIEARLAAAEREIEGCDDHLAKLQEEKDSLETEANAVIEAIKAKRGENGEGFDRIRDLQDEVADLDRQEEARKQELLRMRRRSLALDRERQERASRVKKASDDVRLLADKAGQLGPRPDGGGARARKRRDVERELETWRRAAGFGGTCDEDAVRARMEELRAAGRLKLAEIERLSGSRRSIGKWTDQQRKAYVMMEDQATMAREVTARHLADVFQEIAAVRNLVGRCKIDHEAEEMELKISTSVGARNVHGEVALREDMASLSGGERSFTTIALMLSIWDCAACPFHMCDEFDVYLDSVARKQALLTIHRESKRSSSKQFFFLSPQDESVIPRDDETTIHKMPAPQRVKRG